MTPEGKIKAKVKKALDLLEVYRFMPVQNGMGAPGLDFYCCYNGLFFAVETKAKGNKLTPRQSETSRSIAAAGGVVFVIRDDEDIRCMSLRLRFISNDRRAAGIIYDTMLCP